jgi:hypothetical protein
MNDIQPYPPQSPQPQRRRPGLFQILFLILAGLYWLSPIDLLPFVPLDDLLVLGLALYYALGGEG